jgi:subtilisin family serine protease
MRPVVVVGVIASMFLGLSMCHAGEGLLLGGYAVDRQVSAATGRYFVGFYSPPGALERQMVEQHGATLLHAYTLVPALAIAAPSQAVVDAIRVDARVRYVEPDRTVVALGTAQDPEITDANGDAVDVTQDVIRAWIEQPDDDHLLFSIQVQDLSGVDPATGDGLPVNGIWKLNFSLQSPGSAAPDVYFVEMDRDAADPPTFNWGYVDGSFSTTVGAADAGQIRVDADVIEIRVANDKFAGAPGGNAHPRAGDVLGAPSVEVQQLVGAPGAGGLLLTIDAGPDEGGGRDFTLDTVRADVAVAPAGLDFGSLLAGQSRTLAVSVTNNRSQSLTISSAATNAAAFTVTPGSAIVPASGTQAFQVTFAPTASGPQAGTLSLVHDASGSPMQVPLAGSGFSAADGEDTPWGIGTVRAPEVWNRTTGRSIKVAVLDTGIDALHIDLAGRYRGGYNFVADNVNPLDGHGHGTHVSGTIAAERNGVGVVGVAPEAELYALKVLSDEGSGFESDILAAIDWCVQNGMRVASMSLGGRVPSTTGLDTYAAAFEAGLLVVAAAGNGVQGVGTPALNFPAGYPSVFSVGAVGMNLSRASFSDFGSGLEVVAPGVDVRSSFPRGRGHEARVDRGASRLDANPFEFAALTLAQGITALAVPCGLGALPSDYPPQVAGNIALIQRGGPTFAMKVTAAQDAGAIAVILYNNEAGNFNGTLGSARDDANNRDWVPVVSLAQADGQALAQAGATPVTVYNIVSDFEKLAGTSMACPHVSGVAALVLGTNPLLTNRQVQDILTDSARDLGPPGWDPEYGYGLVNAVAAVDRAGTPPRITVVESDDPAVASSGGWHEVDDSRATLGRYRRNVGGKRGTADAYLELHYTGNRIEVQIARGPRGGTAEAFVDGLSRGRIDFYRAPTDPGKPDNSGKKDLTFGDVVGYDTPSGDHVFRLEVVNDGTDTQRNMIYVDGFVVHEGGQTGTGSPSESSMVQLGSVPAFADLAHGATCAVPAVGSTTLLTGVLEVSDGTDLDLVLLDPQGIPVRHAASSAPTEVLRWSPRMPGTYTFVVVSNSGVAAPYALYAITTQGSATPTGTVAQPSVAAFRLGANHPNPFNPSTQLE